MINEAAHVNVRDSSLTMAGGHANHVAFNISLNEVASPRPTSSAHVWLRFLGEWLLGSSTVSPVSHPSPSDTLVADDRVSQAAQSQGKGSNSSPGNQATGVEIVRRPIIVDFGCPHVSCDYRSLWNIWTSTDYWR